MDSCPQCGNETPEDQWQEGYCVDCCTDQQRSLDEHNAQFDHWNGLTEKQKTNAIRRAYI